MKRPGQARSAGKRVSEWYNHGRAHGCSFVNSFRVILSPLSSHYTSSQAGSEPIRTSSRHLVFYANLLSLLLGNQ